MMIAHLMGSLNRGGAETLVLAICNTARKAALDLILIHRKEGQLSDEFRDSSVPMFRVTPRSFFDIRYFLDLRRLIADNKVQIIHTHQVIDAVRCYLATVGKSVPIVLTLHGHGVKDSRFSNLLRYFAILWSDRVVFVSEVQRTHYLNKYGSIPHARILPNGIAFNVAPDLNTPHLRKAGNIPYNVLLLGSVGNFTSGRDQLTICRFLALLQKKDIPFKFWFIGSRSHTEPELYDGCVDYCESHGLSEQVTFLGSRSDVPMILPELDAFMYSSVHDTFGMAVVEAMAAGIPVFVNDWKVMQEITNYGEWATLYKSKDEHDLYQKFCEFYAGQDRYKTKAKYTANQVKARYSIDNHIQNLEALYSDLLP